MAETAILARSQEANVYAQLRALEQLDETVLQYITDAARQPQPNLKQRRERPNWGLA
jgi:hypothetical protein